jgi:hypothetical protein
MSFDKDELHQFEELLTRKLDEQHLELIGKLEDQRVELIGKLDEQRVELTGKLDEQRVELTGKLDEQRVGIMSDVRSLLQPIKDDLSDIKERLDELMKTEAEDVNQAIIEIESLKKKVRQLEQRLAVLEH